MERRVILNYYIFSIQGIMEDLMSFCPSCGEENSANERLCKECGEKLSKAKDYNPTAYDLDLSELDEVDTAKYRLIDENPEYYLKKFEDMDATENIISWNWSAFFLGLYWIVFRKMYLVAAVIYGVNLFLAVLSKGSGIINLIFSIAIGCFGNLMYKNQIEKRAKEALETDMNIDQFYKKKGGTNPMLVVALIIVSIILWAIALRM